MIASRCLSVSGSSGLPVAADAEQAHIALQDPGRSVLAVFVASYALAAQWSACGVEPSEGFRATAAANLGDRVQLFAGNADAMALDDAAVDVVVSALMLNFVPDPRAALAEMARVTCAGGTIGAYVWDYAGKMELMPFFWDAAIARDPSVAALDEGLRFPLCSAPSLQTLFHTAGLADVSVAPIDILTPFASFDDYWQPFLGGQGPARAYAMSLDGVARAALRDGVAERLPIQSDGSIDLIARAWAVRGTVV